MGHLTCLMYNRQVHFISQNEDFVILSSCANIAQLVEHVHGKDEVIGSIPIVGSVL